MNARMVGAATVVRSARPRPARRPFLILGGLSLLLAVLSLVSLNLGPDYISPTTILGIALQWLPVHPTRTWSDVDVTIVTLVRFPRLLTAILVGAALAVTGAAFQAMFRNPLADPGIIGTSAGASMGAILALALPIQIAWLGFSLVSLAAFGGALGAMFLVYFLARVGNRLPSTTLLLAGFAVSAAMNALAALIESLSDQLRQMYIWLLGNLDQTTTQQLTLSLPLLAIGMLGLFALAGDLNVLLLGDEQAQYLGMHVARRRLLILVLGSLLAGTAVALAGLIAFVGLLVPHIARLLFGANHRLLLPASALLGAIFLLVADTLARMVLAPQELPVGLVTALVGAPWFLVLLRRKKGEYGF
ncbi:MAG TPA: iron ABC transporter permease [Chloroflexota bacterium]|nr:iron ABC transporter permease [Chloroflexota bacterium]